jgi:hypothetical protein
MAKNKYTPRILIGLAAFVVYLLVAARPIPPEAVLVPQWLRSLESGYPRQAASGAEDPPEGRPLGELIPFRLGPRFGYFDSGGVFSLSRETQGGLAMNRDFWALYDGEGAIEVRNPQDERVIAIARNQGYPLFMDGRFFLLGDELNYLTALDVSGAAAWTYDFAAPITGIDAAAGMVLTGFLDGTVEILDSQGRRIFDLKPGGSRLAAIYACRISRDGSRLAIVSGYDDQRFLLLERSGDSWKVAYHEFLSDGFRRDVHLAFVDGDRRVAFEREGGIGIYDIAGRRAYRADLEGRVYRLEGRGDGNLLFAITALSETRKELVAIRYPGTVIMRAPFRSRYAFLERQGDRLYVGGGSAIASFSLERR